MHDSRQPTDDGKNKSTDCVLLIKYVLYIMLVIRTEMALSRYREFAFSLENNNSDQSF